MPRTAFDSVNVAKLPVGTHYLAYINGKYTSSNFAEVRARFPTAIIYRVTVDGSMTIAELIDCENGDYSPARAAETAKWQISQGFRPTIYANRITKSLVDTELAFFNLSFGKDVDWFASTLDGTTDVPGSVAVQFTDNGGAFDTSTITDDAWHPDTVAPIVTPYPEDNMVSEKIQVEIKYGQGWVLSANVNKVVGVTVDDTTPHDTNIPAFVGITPDNHVNFVGPIDGIYTVNVWSVS